MKLTTISSQTIARQLRKADPEGVKSKENQVKSSAVQDQATISGSNRESADISSQSKEQAVHHGGKEYKVHHSHEHHKYTVAHKSMETGHKGVEIGEAVHHAQHVSNVAQHASNTVNGTGQVAHGLVAAHGTGQVSDGLVAAHDVSQATQHAVEATQQASQHANEIINSASTVAHHTGGIHDAVASPPLAHHYEETLNLASNAGHQTGILAAGAIGLGAGVVGTYFAIKGFKNLKHAIKGKNLMEGIEGTGEMARGLQGGVNCARLLSNATGTLTVLQSPIVQGVSSGLGIVHGAADIIIGSKEIYDGIKAKDKSKIALGSMDVGIGLSVTALALGGGVPAAAVLGVVFLTKMGIQNREWIAKGCKKLAQKTGKGMTWAKDKAVGGGKSLKNLTVKTGEIIAQGGTYVAGKTKSAVKTAVKTTTNKAQIVKAKAERAMDKAEHVMERAKGLTINAGTSLWTGTKNLASKTVNFVSKPGSLIKRSKAHGTSPQQEKAQVKG